MDRFKAMQVFYETVDGGSFSAASRKLGMPLATVSRVVADLETHLKTRLLNRSTRRIALTEAGRAYLGACKQILEQLDEAERGAAGEYSAPRGDLTITAPIVFGRLHVLPVVNDFLGAYPDINVRLIQGDRLAHLLDEHIDAAVRIGPLPDSGLIATRIGTIRQVVCASTKYLKEKGVPLRPGDLASHPCITFEVSRSRDAWTFGSGKTLQSVAIHSRLSVNTAEAAIDAAMAGLGVTSVLSYQVANLVHSGAMQIVLAGCEPPPWPVHLLYGSQGLIPLKLPAFLDFAAPRLKARLANASIS